MKYLCGKCIHFDVCYVPRSIGCVEICGHYKAEPKEPTNNEEWFCGLSTEEKAEFLSNSGMFESSNEALFWLKEKHDG